MGAAQGDGPPGEEPTYAAGPQPEPGGPLPWPGPYPHPGPSSGPAPFPSPGAYPDPGPYPQPDQYRPPGGFAPAGPYPYPPAGPYPGRGPYADGTYPPTPHPPGSPPFPGPPGLPSDIGTAAPPAHRWGLGAYLLVEAVFLLTAALVALLLVGDVPSAGELAVALAVPTVLAAGTALLITRVRGNGPRIDLVLAWSWRDVGLGLAFGFGGLVLTIPASILYVTIVGQDATSAVGEVFGDIRAGVPLAVLVFLIVVVVAPLCEEIVYRGLLWGGVERLGGRWTAFGVTTLLFALAHFEFTRTPLLLVVAIPIAAARLYTGRLLPSIVAHQVNNLLPGVALMLGLLGVLPMG